MTTASDKPASSVKRAPRKPAVAAEAPKIEAVEPIPAPAKAAKPAKPAPKAPISKAPAATPVLEAAPQPAVIPAVIKQIPVAPEPVPAPVAASPATSPAPVAAPVEIVEPVAAAPAAPSEAKSVPTPSQPPIDKVSQMTATPTPTFKGYDELAAFGKANIDALIQANTVFSKGIEAISKEFIALTQAQLESTAAAAKAIFAAKTLKDVVELNAEFHKANFDKLVANSTKLGELGTKVATDTFAPLSARVTSVVEKAAKPAA